MLFSQWHMKRLLSLQTSDYASPLPDNYLVSKNLSKEFYLKTEQFILLVVGLFRNLFSSLSFIARQPFWHSFCIMEMMQAVPSQSQRLLQRYEGLPLSTSNHRTVFIPLRKWNQLMGICFYFNLIVNCLSLVSKTLQYIALLLNFTCGLGNEALLHCSSLYLGIEECRKWVSASKSE